MAQADVVSVDGRTVVVVATVRGTLVMLDVSTGEMIGTPMRREAWSQSIATTVIDGVPLCFLATKFSSSKYGVAVVDLRTGRERPVGRRRKNADEPARLEVAGYQDKPLNVVALPVDSEGRRVVLIGGPFSFLRKWTWPPDTRVRRTLEMHEPVPNTYVTCLAASTLERRFVAVAGNERGLLAVWDLATDELLARCPAAHQDRVTALGLAEWSGRGVIVSGGSSHVRFWSMSLELVFEINMEAPIVALTPLPDGQLVVVTQKGIVSLEISQL